MRRAGLWFLVLAACKFTPGAAPSDSQRTDAPIDAPHPDVAVDTIDARTDGLLAWYPLEALSGTKVPDASGNQHDGTCATCPQIVTGKVGLAGDFGGGERFDVAPTGGLQMLSAFTIAMWMKLDTNLTDSACAVNKGLGSGGANSWQICITSTSQNVFFGTSSNSLYSIGTIPTGQWRYVAITWDGYTKQILIDGAQDDSTIEPAISYDGRPITIGADIDDPVSQASYAPFPGILDEVRIYDHALTQSEIQALMN